MKYYLFAGTDHNLAEYEVSAAFPTATLVSPGLYSFEEENEDKAISLVSRLGSAIKLALFIDGWTEDVDQITSEIKTENFSVSLIPPNPEKSLEICNQVKDVLGKKYRFILPKNNFGLSPIVLSKQDVTEFIIIKDLLLRTIWIHDLKHWIMKDRGVPFANAKAGLLPPKVARMLINMAGVSSNSNKTLLDPFCGSGRVLIEGLELGFIVTGSDISNSQISECQANLDYLSSDKSKYSLFTSDASRIFREIPQNSVDLIVTEPFMGKPNTRVDRIPDMVKGLRKLYLGALKSWLHILKRDGTVVMVFPQILDGKRTYITSSVVDDPHLIGYNVSLRDVIYSRPNATVRREIVILKKLSK